MNCQCIVGTNIETAFTVERYERFYLNTAHPAPCNGTINSWRYCFYNPGNIGDNYIYKTTFAIYRAVDTGYQRVSNVTTVSWSGREINDLGSPSFNCYNVSINSFTIEAGNFVAACVYESADETRQLDVVGRRAADYSLMRMNDVSQCSENSLPSNVLSSQLTRTSRILHLYAIITSTLKVCTTSGQQYI